MRDLLGSFDKGRGFYQLVFLFFCTGLLFLSQIERNHFDLLILLVSALFLFYLLLLKNPLTEKTNWIFAAIVYGSALFVFPNLSNDVYRFLWDGKLLALGINPYQYLPRELLHLHFLDSNQYLKDVYALIDPLSQENYSCYPILNQLYFFLASLLSSATESIFWNIFTLRLLMLLTVFAGFYFFDLILKLQQVDVKLKWIFIFNPLVLIEVAYNLHFEGVMLTFIIIAIYAILKEKYVLAGIMLGLAIQIKLIPFIILPFLLRWIGWKNSMITWIITILTAGISSLILLDQTNVLHFLSSIQLYFSQFEFNSFLLHWYIEYGEWRYGYNRIQTFGPYLSRVAMKIMIVLALYRDHFSFQTFMKRLMFAFFVYYLCSSMVHPWYLILPLFCSIFTKYKFLLVWSFFVFLSYFSYTRELDEGILRFIQAIEYLAVLTCLLVEIITKTKHHFRSIS